MKRLFIAFIFFLSLLGGGYMLYLPELQEMWATYIENVPLYFGGEIAQADLQTDNAAVDDLLKQLGEPSDSEMSVPSFDLPKVLPSEEASEQEVPSFAVIFKGFDRAVISSKITSTVVKITHRMGEHFQEGDLLIKLDDTVYQGLRKKAEGNLNKAMAELNAKKELFAADIASIYEVKTAEANVAIAQSEVINANYAIDACYIVAPYDGNVVTLFVEEFELIQEGKPLIEIVNDQFLIGQVLAPVSFISKVKRDQPVDIYIKELNKVVAGKILRIDAVIDPASSTFKIDIVVDNKQGLLKAGMIGLVGFELPPVPAKPASDGAY
jgi:RND family efflux transporter MFP subunit